MIPRVKPRKTPDSKRHCSPARPVSMPLCTFCLSCLCAISCQKFREKKIYHRPSKNRYLPKVRKSSKRPVLNFVGQGGQPCCEPILPTRTNNDFSNCDTAFPTNASCGDSKFFGIRPVENSRRKLRSSFNKTLTRFAMPSRIFNTAASNSSRPSTRIIRQAISKNIAIRSSKSSRCDRLPRPKKPPHASKN